MWSEKALLIIWAIQSGLCCLLKSKASSISAIHHERSYIFRILWWILDPWFVSVVWIGSNRSSNLCCHCWSPFVYQCFTNISQWITLSTSGSDISVDVSQPSSRQLVSCKQEADQQREPQYYHSYNFTPTLRAIYTFSPNFAFKSI